jgi:hypothetical protein
MTAYIAYVSHCVLSYQCNLNIETYLSCPSHRNMQYCPSPLITRCINTPNTASQDPINPADPRIFNGASPSFSDLVGVASPYILLRFRLDDSTKRHRNVEIKGETRNKNEHPAGYVPTISSSPANHLVYTYVLPNKHDSIPRCQRPGYVGPCYRAQVRLKQAPPRLQPILIKWRRIVALPVVNCVCFRLFFLSVRCLRDGSCSLYQRRPVYLPRN